MATLGLKTSAFLETFAARLPPPGGARVLDAGCGAGRDSRWLIDHGFDTAAFDISQEMVNATRDNTSHRVMPRQLDFRVFNDAPGSWQGIWAMASLLHLPRHDIAGVLERLLLSLTEDGILAFSVKRGGGEDIDARGRPMSYFEVSEISQLTFAAMPEGGKVEAEVVVEPDSSGRKVSWINLTAMRTCPS